MKKVIFVCLLSLSICLSKPADEQGKLSQVQNTNVIESKNVKNATEEPKVSPNATTIEQKPPNVTDTTHLQETSTVPSKTTNATQPASDENKTTPDKKNTVPQIDTDKKNEELPKVTESTTETKGTVDNKDKAKNSTKPEENPEKDTATATTTEKSAVTNKPTEAPKKDEDKPTLQARGFDGPSFIGGIILTLGLLAIGFMGFKYYKTQTERNYHTL
ncbi:unnamed protein product [Parnassius apollo]|uniref:(apollo) hypothetical protein n=1 Tax=Parnassius apollo TaxID=110799 RepID=A0A8S3W1M1_PARAO|nr:unnamed protein product [Parnassius apollo]